MPGSNIFVSHIHEDDEHIASMKALLRERGFEVRDSSINTEHPNRATDPDYIKHEILAPRIDWASTLVVLISQERATASGSLGRSSTPSSTTSVSSGSGHTAPRSATSLTRSTSTPTLLLAGKPTASRCDLGDINDWDQSDGAGRPVRDIARFGC